MKWMLVLVFTMTDGSGRHAADPRHFEHPTFEACRAAGETFVEAFKRGEVHEVTVHKYYCYPRGSNGLKLPPRSVR